MVAYWPEVEEKQYQLLNKSYKPIGIVTAITWVNTKGHTIIHRYFEKDGQIYRQFLKEVDPRLINEGA